MLQNFVADFEGILGNLISQSQINDTFGFKVTQGRLEKSNHLSISIEIRTPVWHKSFSCGWFENGVTRVISRLIWRKYYYIREKFQWVRRLSNGEPQFYRIAHAHLIRWDHFKTWFFFISLSTSSSEVVWFYWAKMGHPIRWWLSIR